MNQADRKINGTKQSRVIEDMRDQIIAGSLDEGGKLPSEQKLVEKYGVSRTTIRGAIQKLSQEGLVEVRHGYGTFVRHIGTTFPTSPSQRSHLPSLLEQLGTTLSAHPLSAEEHQRLESLIKHLSTDWLAPINPKHLRKVVSEWLIQSTDDPEEMLQSLRELFTLDKDTIQELIRKFHSEWVQPRSDETGKCGSIWRLPLLTTLPTGQEHGTGLGLDWGGTEFKLAKVRLHGNKEIEKADFQVRSFAFTDGQKVGTAGELFDTIASFVIDSGFIDSGGEYFLGFSIGFVVKHDDAGSAMIVRLGKDFRVIGLIDSDIEPLLVKALYDACEKAGKSNIKLSAPVIANDTVASQIAVTYKEPSCQMGLIVATGFNISTSWKPHDSESESLGAEHLEKLIIENTEAGEFDKVDSLITPYDTTLVSHEMQFDSDASMMDNPRVCTLGKMINGEKLGELVRLIVGDIGAKTDMFKEWIETEGFKTRRWFKTEYMSVIADDETEQLTRIKQFLETSKITSSSLAERRGLQEICNLVAKRSAHLVGTALAAIILKGDFDPKQTITIAVDGSVYHGYPRYGDMVREGLILALGKERADNIQLYPFKESSSVGAAVMAIVANKVMRPL